MFNNFPLLIFSLVFLNFFSLIRQKKKKCHFISSLYIIPPYFHQYLLVSFCMCEFVFGVCLLLCPVIMLKNFISIVVVVVVVFVFFSFQIKTFWLSMYSFHYFFFLSLFLKFYTVVVEEENFALNFIFLAKIQRAKST